jgi:hypothetical protein
MAKNSTIQRIECLQGWLNHLEASRKRRGIKKSNQNLTKNEK